MHCPHCKVPLVMTERSGIEIDYCPQCRGVWLDRGELDKIIERAAVPQPSAPAQPHMPQHQQPAYQQFGGHSGKHGSQYSGKHGSGHSKKKSILGELFDF